MKYLAQHPWAWVVFFPCVTLITILVTIALCINIGRFVLWSLGYRNSPSFDDLPKREFRARMTLEYWKSTPVEFGRPSLSRI
jgi:hypothetical protein